MWEDALYGNLSSTNFPHPGSEGKNRPERLVPLVPKAESEAADKQRAQELAAIDREIKEANEAKAAIATKPARAKISWLLALSALSMFPATAERIMVMPKITSSATAPRSQKSKWRQEAITNCR